MINEQSAIDQLLPGNKENIVVPGSITLAAISVLSINSTIIIITTTSNGQL